MNLISQGESERRIDTSTKDQELLVIGNMINTMLNNMDKNIRDIYQLQLSQRCQNTRALKPRSICIFIQYAGIYRMYAVMQEQDELGDIIYEFLVVSCAIISPDERRRSNELNFAQIQLPLYGGLSNQLPMALRLIQVFGK